MRKVFVIGSLVCSTLFGLTIEEKKAYLLQKEGGELPFERAIAETNEELFLLRTELEEAYAEVTALQQEGSSEESYRNLLSRVNEIKGSIVELEKNWRKKAVSEGKHGEEGYAFWDQEETTLGQIIMEYGAPDYLYVVPSDMAALKLNMHSMVPIPRESWGEVLEILLTQNGIGVKKLTPYTRQLYLFKQDLAAVRTIVATPQELALLPSTERVFYLFSPPVEQLRSIYQFLERFADAKQTFLYQVGGKIAIVSLKEEVEKLLSLYELVWKGGEGKVTRVIPIAKLNVKEMEKVLSTFFSDALEKGRPSFGKSDQSGLSIFSLVQGNSLVLIGQEETVARAERVVRDMESQLLDPSEMAIYHYTCRHSDPIDLSSMLEKVYATLVTIAGDDSHDGVEVAMNLQGAQRMGPEAFQGGALPAGKSVQGGASASIDVEPTGVEHFIPDPKTGSLLMVVRRSVYPKIRDLLRKLDVPKKMVQIEVLLFERTLNSQNSFGLNLLKLGDDKNGIKFQGSHAPASLGVFEFFFSGEKSQHFPAFDLAYSFLMTQEDVQLTSAPSLMTVNQTPATISIQDEISINNGAAPINADKGSVFEKSFTRAAYGINIVLTPIIHVPDDQIEDAEEKAFITLQTDISFDTIKPTNDNQPPVNRRKIENEIRVLDGQTVILGGLRRKTARSEEDKIPFLGDIPGIGRLFGSTRLTDDNTEMFIFITPRIVVDTREEFEKMRIEEVKKRSGDIPEFLDRLLEAREKERKSSIVKGLKAFW